MGSLGVLHGVTQPCPGAESCPGGRPHPECPARKHSRCPSMVTLEMAPPRPICQILPPPELFSRDPLP